MSRSSFSLSPMLALTSMILASSASAFVAIDWITIGDPGNACDTQSQGCFGTVADPYQISKFEVTNAQYAEFLNAVAATDTNALYSTSMGSGVGGIARSGSAGSFSYNAIAGREKMPVNFVSFWDAARFANWLHHGQPQGIQSDSTTEDGVYTLAMSAFTRNAGANVFVTSEDEWYKAAYYDPGAMSYFDYPAGSDTQTACTVPGATANTANCGNAVGDVTEVGGYAGAASPSGTFDQGGNVWEWNEDLAGPDGRRRRGGAFSWPVSILPASFQGGNFAGSETEYVGFRVASPAPAVPSLGALGAALLSSVLGLAGFRWLHR